MRFIAASLVPLAIACAAMPTSASDSLSTEERAAVLRTVTSAVHNELGLQAGALQLVPEQLRRQGNWLFLTAGMHAPDGQSFDYSGTTREGAAAAGLFSRLSVALLVRSGGHWKITELAVGPTDVVWEGWADKHQTPAGLFP